MDQDRDDYAERESGRSLPSLATLALIGGILVACCFLSWGVFLLIFLPNNIN